MQPIRVDFYLSQEEQADSIWLLACRLTEKAYLRGHRIFLFCANQEDAEQIDELLWTYKDDSFVPHNLQGEGPEPPPPVQIGFAKEPRGFNDILINLTPEIPSFYTRFNRIIEIVAQDEDAKHISRNHYREYRANSCQLYIHHV